MAVGMTGLSLHFGLRLRLERLGRCQLGGPGAAIVAALAVVVPPAVLAMVLAAAIVAIVAAVTVAVAVRLRLLRRRAGAAIGRGNAHADELLDVAQVGRFL